MKIAGLLISVNIIEIAAYLRVDIKIRREIV